MKTITMDFNTYEQEKATNERKAYLLGFSEARRLVHMILVKRSVEDTNFEDQCEVDLVNDVHNWLGNWQDVETK